MLPSLAFLALAPTIALSAVAGFAFAGLGLSYRWGQQKNIQLQMIFSCVAFVGTVVFLVRCLWLGELRSIPAPVILWAIPSSLGQVAAITLMAAAMKRGAFGPVWCALNLNFFPVAIYYILFTDDPTSPGRWIAMALALGCVIVATLDKQAVTQTVQPNKPSEGPPSFRIQQSAVRIHLLYGLCLLLLMLSNGLVNVALKDLNIPHSSQPALIPAYTDAFMFLFYAILLVCMSLYGIVAKKKLPPLKVVAAPALVASAGSLIGLACMMAAGGGPDVVAFIVSSILSVLGGFLGAAIFFKDPLTRLSWLVIALGIAAMFCTTF